MKTTIKQTRLDLKMTQSEFGKNVGVSRAMINRYENGRAIPRANVLDRILNLEKQETDQSCICEGEILLNRTTKERMLEYNLVCLFRLLTRPRQEEFLKLIAQRVSDTKDSMLNQALNQIIKGSLHKTIHNNQTSLATPVSHSIN